MNVSGVSQTGWGRPQLNGFHYGLFFLRCRSVESSTSPKKKPFFISLTCCVCILSPAVLSERSHGRHLLHKKKSLGMFWRCKRFGGIMFTVTYSQTVLYRIAKTQ